MFNDNCYECDSTIIKEKGMVYGYWGELKVEFIKLPKIQCSNSGCGEFYLDEEIAVLTQEITRALHDINIQTKVVNIGDSFETLVNHLDKVYEMIVNKKIYLIETNGQIIINSKDVNSLFHDDGVLLAARNNHTITDDVQKEIDSLLEEKRDKK